MFRPHVVHLRHTALLAAACITTACSPSANGNQAATLGQSNAAALRQLKREREALPVNSTQTVSADDVVRMDVYAALKPPSTPGNPSHLSVCATLYDRSGRAVAAEGDFSTTSDLGLGGMHVYAPMFAPVEIIGRSSPLGFCPSGAELWPDRLAQLIGQSFTIELTFVGGSGKRISGTTNQSF